MIFRCFCDGFLWLIRVLFFFYLFFMWIFLFCGNLKGFGCRYLWVLNAFCGFVISICERYGFFKGLLIWWDFQAQQNQGLLAYYLWQGQISFSKFHFLYLLWLRREILFGCWENFVWDCKMGTLTFCFASLDFFLNWKLNLCLCYRFYCMIKSWKFVFMLIIAKSVPLLCFMNQVPPLLWKEKLLRLCLAARFYLYSSKLENKNLLNFFLCLRLFSCELWKIIFLKKQKTLFWNVFERKVFWKTTLVTLPNTI